jgi:hypothetical protein
MELLGNNHNNKVSSVNIKAILYKRFIYFFRFNAHKGNNDHLLVLKGVFLSISSDSYPAIECKPNNQEQERIVVGNAQFTACISHSRLYSRSNAPC